MAPAGSKPEAREAFFTTPDQILITLIDQALKPKQALQRGLHVLPANGL